MVASVGKSPPTAQGPYRAVIAAAALDAHQNAVLVVGARGIDRFAHVAGAGSEHGPRPVNARGRDGCRRDLIRVAVARVPSQAIPLFGTYWGDREDELGMKVEVNVKTASALRADLIDFGGR
jgi:hypothetical protein